MYKLLILLICAPLFAMTEPDVVPSAKSHGNSKARELRMELDRQDLLPLARRTDWALANIVSRATEELRRQGFREMADRYDAEYFFQFSSYLSRAVESRDIGDHKPLIEWLADFYNKLEAILGVSVCKSLHLSDIKTLNYCIPVVFKPCTFLMDQVTITRKDEYRNHFSGGAIYYGLVPVLTYWVIDIPCMVGTSGIAAFLCGPAANAGEYAMYKWLAPKLSDNLFDRVCK